MTGEQRKALRTLARAVREGEAALEVIREAKLDDVAPATGLIEKLRELREVNERRQKLAVEVHSALAATGVKELSARWPNFATVGAQVLALVGK